MTEAMSLGIAASFRFRRRSLLLSSTVPTPHKNVAKERTIMHNDQAKNIAGIEMKTQSFQTIEEVKRFSFHAYVLGD